MALEIDGLYDEILDEHPAYEVLYIYRAEAAPPYNIVYTSLAYLDFQDLNNVSAFQDAP